MSKPVIAADAERREHNSTAAATWAWVVVSMGVVGWIVLLIKAGQQ